MQLLEGIDARETAVMLVSKSFTTTVIPLDFIGVVNPEHEDLEAQQSPKKSPAWKAWLSISASAYAEWHAFFRSRGQTTFSKADLQVGANASFPRLERPVVL